MDERTVVTTAPDNGSDPLLYRLVVGILGAAILITLLGGLILTAMGKPMGDGLIALGAGSVGALAGLLAPAPVRG